jgi:hypothetical protein
LMRALSARALLRACRLAVLSRRTVSSHVSGYEGEMKPTMSCAVPLRSC